MTVEQLMKYLKTRSPTEKVYIIRTAWEEEYVDDMDYDDLIIGERQYKYAKENYDI